MNGDNACRATARERLMERLDNWSEKELDREAAVRFFFEHVVTPLRIDKGHEYAVDGDPNGNFYRTAARTGQTPYQVWNSLFCKHLDSIWNWINNQEHKLVEPIEGRIADAVNYLVLLASMIDKERRSRSDDGKRETDDAGGGNRDGSGQEGTRRNDKRTPCVGSAAGGGERTDNGVQQEASSKGEGQDKEGGSTGGGDVPEHNGGLNIVQVDKINWKRPHMGPPILMVIGGQWGSEAKGMVAAALCEERDIDYAVRTGAVNAGHTVYYEGSEYKMQQLPTGWVNPDTKLVIGPGALINPAILDKELSMVACARDASCAVVIDPRAGLHLSHHQDRAAQANRHHSMGATGKGCSEALVDRISKRGTGETLTFGDWCREVKVAEPFRWLAMDTEKLLNEAYDRWESILLEATQGQMLDMYLGPYPYTTHKPTGPGVWLAEAGLSPNLKYEIAMVVRTYPIRVAGNSGPMSQEIEWIDLANTINDRLFQLGLAPKVHYGALQAWGMVTEGQRLSGYTPEERAKHQEYISEFHANAMKRLPVSVVAELSKLFEFTTVTKKLRRIAAFDEEAVKTSIRQIRPDYLVLTFVNYVYPELWGRESHQIKADHDCWDFMQMLGDRLGVEIRYFTTGPESRHFIRID